MPRHFISAAPGHDAHRSIGETPKQGRVRFLQVEDNGEVVRRVDVIDKAIRRRLCATNPALKQGIKGPLHVARSEWATVVKLCPVMQMKDAG